MKYSNLIQLSALLIMLLLSACDQGYYEDEFFEDEFIENNDGFEDEWGDEDEDDGDYGDDEDDHDHGGQSAEGFAILTSYEIQGNEINKIKDFDVSGQHIGEQQDYAKHLAMWDYFATLIPIENRTYITEFLVINGGGDLGGYVEPIVEGKLDKWRMALSIDLGGDLSNVDLQAEFAYVAIHEFGHVLTLNPTQVKVQSESSCNTYHTGEGCSKENSYINRLFDLAWADIIDNYSDGDSDRLYNDYPDRFVSDYAATNPGEDIAEVFSIYVIEQNVRTGSSIADQKVQLLDAYPELQTLRRQIRQVEAVGMITDKHKKYKPSNKRKLN